MNRMFYPSVFHSAEEGGYWVSFPDFPECLTEGDTIEQSYEMAVDALGLAITSRSEEKEEIPDPSPLDTIVVDADSFLVIIEFDYLAYKKRTNSRAVKKTLSIPEWLNQAATEEGINFSQVLQDALKEKLHVE